MKKLVVWTGIYVLVVILQVSFGNLLEIADIKPNFILILLVAVSLWYGRLVGSVSGFFMGLGQDSVISLVFGLHALCYAFVGFLASIVPWRFTGNGKTDAIIVLFGAAFVHDLIYNWLYAFNTDATIWWISLRYAFPGAIYTTIIGILGNVVFKGFLQVKGYARE